MKTIKHFWGSLCTLRNTRNSSRKFWKLTKDLQQSSVYYSRETAESKEQETSWHYNLPWSHSPRSQLCSSLGIKMVHVPHAAWQLWEEAEWNYNSYKAWFPNSCHHLTCLMLSLKTPVEKTTLISITVSRLCGRWDRWMGLSKQLQASVLTSGCLRW